MDSYAHLRTLYITFKAATGPARIRARRELLLEGVRLGLTIIGLHNVLLGQHGKAN